ncbi:MAG TPA: hypothetical protein VMZ50_00325 [Phycisphaerae bacterium]|nr:hypothetical protein [Phycisphaerae bacterium]
MPGPLPAGRGIPGGRRTEGHRLGGPQETESTLADTADAIRRIRCDTVVLSIFTPYPGTEAFELCRAEELLPDSYDPSLYNHQSPANCFCRDIPPQRFRELVCEIEQMVDRRNRRSRFRRLLSVKTVQRARQLGLRNAFGKLARTFLRR